jgi:hypothetical protein
MFDVASFLTGFVLATTLGMVFQRIRILQGPINAPNRTMNTFPDAVQESLTSRMVVTTSYQAFLLQIWYILLLLVVLGVGVWVIIEWASSSGFTLFGESVCL